MYRENKKTKNPKTQRLKTFVVLTLFFEIDLHPKVRQILYFLILKIIYISHYLIQLTSVEIKKN